MLQRSNILMRKIENEVHVQRRKEPGRFAEMSKSFRAAAVSCIATHVLEQAIVETLDANREARHTSGTQRLENFRNEITRIRLDRYFPQAEKLAHQFDRLHQLL